MTIDFTFLLVVGLSLLFINFLIIALITTKRWKKQESRHIVYVPTVLTDTREYAEKWQDQDYLITVRGFTNNNVYKTEILAALNDLRRFADGPDIDTQQLKGVNYGIRALKGLLVLPDKANAQLKLIQMQHESTEKRKADSFG